jgi:hypothetical protein
VQPQGKERLQDAPLEETVTAIATKRQLEDPYVLNRHQTALKGLA